MLGVGVTGDHYQIYRLVMIEFGNGRHKVTINNIVYNIKLIIIIILLQTLRHIQNDYEKRLKDVETQKEQLLDEMESRETTLINKVL